MKLAFSHLIKICLSTFGCFCATGKISLAQVTPDATVNTQANQNGDITEITGGETRGSNLFHSFQDFSVQTGNEAFFDNANNVSNIFSRVTGGDVSNIDGAIRANGNANLFLINPTGIIFGENARLNIGGSFFGSTANSIIFPEGEFSALQPGSESVLTVDVPVGLGFGSNPGDITVIGDGAGTDLNGDLIAPDNALRVNSTSTVGFIGGRLNFEGATIRADGGRIELGSVAANEQVSFGSANGDFSFDYESVTNFEDITVSQNSAIGSSGSVSGNVRVWGNNINLTEGSRIYARTVGDSVTDLTPGSVEINAIDTISFNGENISGSGSSVSNTVRSEALGNAGDIVVDTSSLAVNDGGSIFTSTFGQGDTGSLSVIASDTVTINGENSQGFPSIVGSRVQPEAVGNLGEVTIETNSLLINNGAEVNSSTVGQGNTGLVSINATDTVTIDSENPRGSAILSQVFPGSIGDSGGIAIVTDSLFLNNGGLIDASTGSEGNAGLVNITARDTIIIDGEDLRGFTSSINSGVGTEASGNSGGVDINTGSLSLTNGGQVNASTFGEGDGGEISILAEDTVTIDGETLQGVPSRLISAVRMQGQGDARGVTINTTSLSVTNGATISSNTFGAGNAGSISILASDRISIDGESFQGFPSSIASTVQPEASGNAGGIAIDTASLSFTGGGQVNASTLGLGNAGSIDITAMDTIILDGESSRNSLSSVASIVQPEASGNAGGIAIDTASLSFTGGGQVNASTLGLGNAGSIDITAMDTIILDGESSQGFRSSAVSTVRPGAIGDAGNLSIAANSLSLDNAIIDTVTRSGQGGTVNLQIAEDIRLESNSLISAEALNAANGGNLLIDAKFITATPNQNNDLVTSAEQGAGGNINIVSAGIFGLEEGASNPPNNTNDIDASSDLGVDGTININTTNDFLNSFELINPEFTVAEKALQGSCFARRNSQQGSFVYGGTGGLPVSPDSFVDEEPSLSSNLPEIKLNSQASGSTRINPPSTIQKWQIGDPIVEPTNLIKTADGRSLWINQKANRNLSVC